MAVKMVAVQLPNIMEDSTNRGMVVVPLKQD